MKMKIKNNIVYLFLVLSISLFTSCDEGGTPNPGGTTTKDFAGDWFIGATDASGASVLPFSLHSTYNTAANDDTMWIDDFQHGWYLKSKITVNLADGTFSGVSQPNLNDPGTTVIITEGKIEKGAGLSKAGHKVDKISFKAVFSYDPGTKLTFVGHKRTGFLEDEY
jgi:hypothetical protein